MTARPAVAEHGARKTDKERLSTLPQLEKAARVLARAAKVLLQELELVEEHGADVDVAALWSAVEEGTPRAVVMTAAATVVSLVISRCGPGLFVTARSLIVISPGTGVCP